MVTVVDRGVVIMVVTRDVPVTWIHVKSVQDW
jgi:hypothetical protein